MKYSFPKGLILIALSLLLVGCSEQPKAMDLNNNQTKIVNETDSKEEKIRSVFGITELVVEYEDVDELVSNSQLIVNVKVQNQKTIVHENVPFTISTVKINEVYKGKVVEKTIDVIETGGIYKPEGKPGQDLEKVNVKLNGVSTLQENEKSVLFLEKFEGPQINNAYIPLGAYQGKFNIYPDNKVSSAIVEEKTFKSIDEKEHPEDKTNNANKQLQNFSSIKTLEQLKIEIRNSF